MHVVDGGITSWKRYCAGMSEEGSDSMTEIEKIRRYVERYPDDPSAYRDAIAVMENPGKAVAQHRKETNCAGAVKRSWA